MDGTRKKILPRRELSPAGDKRGNKMRRDGRTWDPNEPARELAYRRLYEHIKTQDDLIDYLRDQIKNLRIRIDAIEQRRSN